MEGLERIESKIDKISDRLNKIEVDVAAQEMKILKRILSTIALVLGLAYSVVKLTLKS